MPAINRSTLADLVCETRPGLELLQALLSMNFGVLFHSLKRWENGRVKLLAPSLKLMKYLLHPSSNPGKDWLTPDVSK